MLSTYQLFQPQQKEDATIAEQLTDKSPSSSAPAQVGSNRRSFCGRRAIALTIDIKKSTPRA